MREASHFIPKRKEQPSAVLFFWRPFLMTISRKRDIAKIFPICLDKSRNLWYNLSREGVASAKRNKSTSWPKGLACFKLRDSCMRIAIHGFSEIAPCQVWLYRAWIFLFGG